MKVVVPDHRSLTSTEIALELEELLETLDEEVLEQPLLELDELDELNELELLELELEQLEDDEEGVNGVVRSAPHPCKSTTAINANRAVANEFN